jgi:hypothetical protein
MVAMHDERIARVFIAFCDSLHRLIRSRREAETKDRAEAFA